MGRYLKQARHHAQRIEYYHKHAGTLGFKQAQHHYFQLDYFMIGADRSKNDRTDAVVIRALRESADKLMEEMRRREEE
jgi:hypothetical protein